MRLVRSRACRHVDRMQDWCQMGNSILMLGSGLLLSFNHLVECANELVFVLLDSPNIRSSHDEASKKSKL